MRQVFFYYLAILIPITGLIWMAKYEHTQVFAASLLLYVLIYRPLVDGYKLIHKGLIEKRQFWKLYLPSTYRKHFKDLYLS